jgi:hypothetical protein
MRRPRFLASPVRPEWTAASGLRLEGFDSKPAQRDALASLALIIGDAPVREAVDGLDLSVPLRIDVPDCRGFGLRKTEWLNLCGAVSFLASDPAWRWRGGRSLLDVPRGSLPLLTRETAVQAVEEVHLSLIDRAA